MARTSPPPEAQAKATDFEGLYEREFPYVWKSLRRLGVRSNDLQDAAHDVLVVAYRRRADYDASRPLRPWLFGICLRVAQEHRRTTRTGDEALDDADEPADPSLPADERLLAEQQRRLVIAVLQTLDIEKRAVLILHDLDGQAMPDIAEAFGLPLNTAYSRLRLARADLAAGVRRLLGRGER